jgi:hypothetical protein
MVSNSRINCLVRNFRIFSPVRDQSPLESVKGSLVSFRIESDCEHLLAWRDVVAHKQIKRRGDRNIVDLRYMFDGSDCTWLNLL